MSGDGRALFMKGLKAGIPIGIGYVPVSVAVSVMASKMGLAFLPWQMMNWLVYSGSGESVILNLISGGETALLMYILAFSIVNCRHILLSLSLAQKTDKNMSFLQRVVFVIFNTDETFAVSMQQKGALRAPYLFGIVVVPYIGWCFGAFAGFVFNSMLPASVKSAFGIMLYSMFLALIVPPMKKSRQISIVVILAASMSILLECVPIVKLTSGQVMMICTIVTCLIGAIFFPVEQEKSGVAEEEENIAENNM